jgi:hypothetical protein
MERGGPVQSRLQRRHQETEAETDRIRKDKALQLTFHPDLHAQQAALRVKTGSASKTQKLLRRRQKAASSALNIGENFGAKISSSPADTKRGTDSDSILNRTAYTQKLVSPSSKSVPKPTEGRDIRGSNNTEESQESESPILTEKKAWVDRLKRENAQLVEMLSVARSAKQQVMNATERLNIDKSFLSEKKLASNERDLEHLIAALPISVKKSNGAGTPSDNQASKGMDNDNYNTATSSISMSGGLTMVPPSAANDSIASARLHSTISRLLFRLRAQQMNIFEHSLELARCAEDAFLDGHSTSSRSAVEQLRDIVYYLDLENLFSDNSGEVAADVLRRRYIAMNTGIGNETKSEPLAQPRPAEEEKLSLLDKENKKLRERIGELEEEVTSLAAKNTAMRNNVLKLRAKKRDASVGASADKVNTNKFDLGAKVEGANLPSKIQGASSPMGDTAPAQPVWNGLSGDWAKLCWMQLVDKATALVMQEPLADRLTAQVISAVSEYVATEMSSHFSQLLKPAIEEVFGPNAGSDELPEKDLPRATEICNRLLEHSDEIMPLTQMALTYVVQSRSSSP